MWSPSDAVLAAVTTPIHYDGPGPWDNGAHCGGSYLPGTAQFAAYIRTFPQVSGVGGYECRQNTANANEMSVHGTGRAIDIMLPKVNGEPNPAGYQIADWLVTHANYVGVQLVIWDHTIWNGQSRVVRVYTGPVPHTDHVHMELTIPAAHGQSAFFGGAVPAGEQSSLLPTAAFVTVLAATAWVLWD